jgi:hypothetical protein
LLDFLEILPADRCGAWAASGWQSVMVDQAALARFNRLLETWTKSAKPFAVKVIRDWAFVIPRHSGHILSYRY